MLRTMYKGFLPFQLFLSWNSSIIFIELLICPVGPLGPARVWGILLSWLHCAYCIRSFFEETALFIPSGCMDYLQDSCCWWLIHLTFGERKEKALFFAWNWQFSAVLVSFLFIFEHWAQKKQKNDFFTSVKTCLINFWTLKKGCWKVFCFNEKNLFPKISCFGTP